MLDKRTVILVFALAVLALASQGGHAADEPEQEVEAAEDDAEMDLEDAIDEEGGVQCIDTRRIRRTSVIDDQNIVFYMRGGTIYRNTLPRRCPGLSQRDAFSYRTTIARLCDIDVITVLEDWGTGLQPGVSCGLGRFHVTTVDEIDALKGAPDAEPAPLPPAEPEQPGTPSDDRGSKD